MPFFEVAPCLLCGLDTAYAPGVPGAPVVCDGCEGDLVERAGARYEEWEGPRPGPITGGDGRHAG